jgi:hypothetical protein
MNWSYFMESVYFKHKYNKWKKTDSNLFLVLFAGMFLKVFDLAASLSLLNMVSILYLRVCGNMPSGIQNYWSIYKYIYE